MTPDDVADVCASVTEAGATLLTLADTTGMATQREVEATLQRTGVDVGLHLHDSRRTALRNACAAYALGIRRFDTAIGGLGGSPFAPSAGGNLATEDLVICFEGSVALFNLWSRGD